MPPRTSKLTGPPRRSPKTTARKSAIPTSPVPHPPENLVPIDPINYQNATQVEELQQQREGNSFDYCDSGPAVAEVNLANSGPVRPEVSSYTNAYVEPIVEPEANNSVGILVHSGSLRPEIANHDASGEMGVEHESVESEQADSGSVRPEVRSYSAEVEPENVGMEDVGRGGRAIMVDGGSESLKEQGARNMGGSGGKRTVVKRVVRVVRKVVRKKVPKRVVKGGGLGIEEDEKIESVTYFNEKGEMIRSFSDSKDVEGASSSVNAIETENSKLSGSVVAEAMGSEDSRNSVMEKMVVKEHSCVVDDIVESKNMELAVAVKEDPSGLRKVRKVAEKRVPNEIAKGALANEEWKKVEDAMNSDEKKEDLEPDISFSESMVVDKVNSSGVALKEMEKSKCNDAVLLEVKNEDSRSTMIKSMEIEKYGSVVDGNTESEYKKELEVAINEEDNRLEDQLDTNKGTLLKLPVSDKPVSLEGERTEGQLGTSALPIIVPLEGERNEDQLERKNAGAVGNDNMDVVEDQNIVPVAESGSGEGIRGVKEPLEDDSDSLNRALVWSGEMEALERRKRRKTEIFVGGLDKDAKEEDIRKVFEEVGEIVEVRLKMNRKTGKNKGFAFVRYNSADDAKTALTRYSKAEECSVKPVEGNDTLFLGNINRKWKSEDVVKLLKEAGIEKIDKVTVKADPSNVEHNRGFAFVELETFKDAQSAFHQLQAKDALGSHQRIKVAWAQPLSEPDEGEILKVKSVYAEYLPSLWDEEEVIEYFKRFGEIENITLAKSLPSSRRKDFAFINYTGREAALACVEAFSREQIDNDGSKVKVQVSLAKPLPRGKQTKHISNAMSKELPKEKRKAAHPIIKPHEPRNKQKPVGSSNEGITVERKSSTTYELVQLLRQQAVSRQAQPGLSIGSVGLNHQFPSLGSKRPFSAIMVDDPCSADPRGLPPLPSGRSYPVQNPSSVPPGVSMASSSYYSQQGIRYASESVSGGGNYPSWFQTRPQAFYYGNSGVHRRC